jgi:hypothetical protein
VESRAAAVATPPLNELRGLPLARVYRHLELGENTFRVQPIDAGGDAEAKATIYSWRIAARFKRP